MARMSEVVVELSEVVVEMIEDVAEVSDAAVLTEDIVSGE